MAKSFANMERDMANWRHEAQYSRVSTQRDLHWDTVNQGLKIKDKENFESRKRKRLITNKEIPKRLSANF